MSDIDERPYLLYEPEVCDLERWRQETLREGGLSLSSALRLLMWSEALRNQALGLQREAEQLQTVNDDVVSEMQDRIDELDAKVAELEAEVEHWTSSIH